jgi:hypothetical protein
MTLVMTQCGLLSLVRFRDYARQGRLQQWIGAERTGEAFLLPRTPPPTDPPAIRSGQKR